MKIIILAHETDNHTKVIKWALEQTGHDVVCWAQMGWQAEQQASISYADEIRLKLGSSLVETGDVVWLRRPLSPELNPRVCELDKKFAEGEYRSSFHSILYLLEALPVRCINTFSAHRLVNNKSVQLQLAKSCGMHVPATLISNSPPEVRSFLPQHQRAICKTFLPHVWQKGDSKEVAITHTAEIRVDHLPKDDVLTFAPAIFQQMVAKSFDVRTVLMGTTTFSYALRTPAQSLDWREGYETGLKVEAVPTPPEVEIALLAFAKRSGIVFGSADFAVDKDGNWWFLEINEQGQFLWLDNYNPEARIQQKFLAFLTLPEGASRTEIEERQSIFPSFQEALASPELQAVPLETPSTTFLSTEPIPNAASSPAQSPGA